MLFIRKLFQKKPADIFSEFATQGLAEAVNVALSALTVAITNLNPLGTIIGEAGKGFTEKLLDKSSELENKIDKLLSSQLITGIKHLHDGLNFEATTAESLAAKQMLLFEAHNSLTKAWSVTIGSIEDSMFVIALDNIALAAHGHYSSLAKDGINRLDHYVRDQETKVSIIEEEAEKVQEDEQAVYRFLYSDPYGDKPFGYGEQKLAYRQIKKYSTKIQTRARQFRYNLELLKGLHLFSQQVYELQNRMER